MTLPAKTLRSGGPPTERDTSTRDHNRHRSRRMPRLPMIGVSGRAPLTPEEQAFAAERESDALLDAGMPKTRADCEDGQRPCPWARCRHHLMLDVSKATGTMRFPCGTTDAAEMGESCALDAADKGGMTLEEIGGLFNLSRERVRQLERSGLEAIARRLNIDGATVREIFAAAEAGVNLETLD